MYKVFDKMERQPVPGQIKEAEKKADMIESSMTRCQTGGELQTRLKNQLGDPYRGVRRGIGSGKSV